MKTLGRVALVVVLFGCGFKVAFAVAFISERTYRSDRATKRRGLVIH